MKYVSTRGASEPVTLSEGLAAGLASDGGLYVPSHLPRVDLAGLDMSDLPAVGLRLLAPFAADDPLGRSLQEVVADAFAPPAPVVATKDPRLHVLELFHGPTAAFKDFGARFLAAALQRSQGAPDLTTILVATSGDTGSAVAAAFHRRPGFRVVVLYPEGRVSPRQAHQLEAFGDNVVTLRVQGSFDDCQALVKGAFGDEALRSDVPMTSANSISLGRLLPQMVYHAAAAGQVAEQAGEKVGLVVPTGNLGNALAAWLAGALGAPIRAVVLATNRNDGLVRWVQEGDFTPRDAVTTLANAMDVGLPSNLERLRWFIDAGVTGPTLHGVSVDDDRIRRTVRAAPTAFGHVVCPHTACALDAYARVAACRRGPWLVAATAHPAKFEEVVEPAIGGDVPLPESLAALLRRPREARSMAADAAALATVLRSAVGT